MVEFKVGDEVEIIPELCSRAQRSSLSGKVLTVTGIEPGYELGPIIWYKREGRALKGNIFAHKVQRISEELPV